MKHTPGSWVARPGAPEHAALIVRELPNYKSTVVATIPMHFDFGDAAVTDWAEQEANARLVAAAPDLLEALQDAVSTQPPDSPIKWVLLARTAIAKATRSV